MTRAGRVLWSASATLRALLMCAKQDEDTPSGLNNIPTTHTPPDRVQPWESLPTLGVGVASLALSGYGGRRTGGSFA